MLVASLLVSSACAGAGASGPAMDCAHQLQDGGYMGSVRDKAYSRDRELRAAEGYCASYTPEQIALAKEMYDARVNEYEADGQWYQGPLHDLLQGTAVYSAAQIRCAIAEYKTKPRGSEKFHVSEACRAAQ